MRTTPRGRPASAAAVGKDRGAERASKDAGVPSIPPLIPYGGFSPVRLEGWPIRRGLPGRQRLKPAPGMRLLTAGLPSPFVHLRSERLPRTAPGRRPDDAPPWRVGRPPPQGPSLRSGLCCPGPSSLNRPHPPHSPAHRDFTAGRLIRDAFAVRERRGDPRVVPGFHYHSVLTCRPL